MFGKSAAVLSAAVLAMKCLRVIMTRGPFGSGRCDQRALSYEFNAYQLGVRSAVACSLRRGDACRLAGGKCRAHDAQRCEGVPVRVDGAAGAEQVRMRGA